MFWIDLLTRFQDLGQNPVFITLLIVIFFDIVTGILTGIYNKSQKNENGGVESRPLIKGLIRKVGLIVLFLFTFFIDFFTGENYITGITATFLIGGEGLSILENLSTCGVPIPKALFNILEVLKKKGDDTKKWHPKNFTRNM